MQQNTVIYTVTANCQDCYRCVRACPVKAIRVTGGQAQIVDELCIKCGTCVRGCPQHAKTIRSTVDKAKALIAEGRQVVASVAPSFVALFSEELAGRLPSALRQLGFCHVCETAEGAKYITEKSLKPDAGGSVCTACPAVVNYVEKYRPDMLDTLIPVVSPMIAHGRMLKERYPGCAVVFIGPCAAKKLEAIRPENVDAINVVITFSELLDWLKEADIHLENCPESAFENSAPIGDSRLFPLQGGMLKTGGMSVSGVDAQVLHISGPENVIGLFDVKDSDWAYRYVEPLFCKGGCICGPAMTGEKSLLARRADVIDYAGRAVQPTAPGSVEVNYSAVFAQNAVADDGISESEINKILERTGKIDPAFQLNCGACGYNNCLENAKAVARGLAEVEMCAPYMRRLAQQRTDRIIETTPNGIVILDSELRMIKMNPAFQKMFMCNNGILGRRISYLINAEGFERLLTGTEESYESIQFKYGIRYHEILYKLKDERQYVGIYSDISKLSFDERQLDVLKTQTLQHAREFLDHQVKFAQEMASYLGKSTAKSEEIAKRLIDLYEYDVGDAMQ